LVKDHGVLRLICGQVDESFLVHAVQQKVLIRAHILDVIELKSLWRYWRQRQHSHRCHLTSSIMSSVCRKGTLNTWSK